MRSSSGILLATATLVMAFVLPSASADRPEGPPGAERVQERVHDSEGRLIWEFGESSSDSDLWFARHYTHRPGHSGGGTPLTDCPATQYALAGWKWSAPYSATASSYADVVNLSAGTWDVATGASILASIGPGSSAVAGIQDFVNQIDWVSLGATTTIAVTTTWYYRTTGEAVESDAQYNTYYLWATDGDTGAMDVQDIATHELGHTFGLSHPKGSPVKISCLTMYAYGVEGEIAKRSLGDGDLLGLRALYGL